MRRLAMLRSAGSRTEILKCPADTSSAVSFLEPAIARTLMYIRKLFFRERRNRFDESAQLTGSKQEHAVAGVQFISDSVNRCARICDCNSVNTACLHTRHYFLLRQLRMRCGALRSGFVDVHFVRSGKHIVIPVERRVVAPGKSMRLKDHHKPAPGEVELHCLHRAARFFVTGAEALQYRYCRMRRQ